MTARLPLFTRQVEGFGCFRLHALRIPEDIPLLHDWVQRDYARYWGMQGHELAAVTAAYASLQASGHAQAWLAWLDDAPAFLMERYDPAHDELGRHYPVQPGDIGMHLLLAPPVQPRSGFSRVAMDTVLAALFAEPSVRRVVVEPDVRNDKIHQLNRYAGFVYHGEIALPHKRAALAFCTRAQFDAHLQAIAGQATCAL